MNEKSFLLVKHATRSDSFDARLGEALRAAGCIVEECEGSQSERMLDLISEGLLPVIFK